MEALKFVPFSSSIHPGFWTELAKIKLEVAGLKEEPVDIIGTFTNSDPVGGALQPRLSVEWNAFEKEIETNWNNFAVKGTVTVKNTIEAFKQQDKAAFIKLEAEKIWSKIADGSWLDSPEELNKFSILMFADLKKFMFYYWFAFPALNIPSSVVVTSCQEGGDVLSSDQLQSLTRALRGGDNSVYSLVLLEEKSVKIAPLSQLGTVDLTSTLVCVSDPSSMAKHPGWTVRNLTAALCHQFPGLVSGLRVLCLRASVKDGQVLAGHSLVITLGGQEPQLASMPGVVGWEKNDKGQLGPRLANMRSSMDPVKLAEGSVDLNLKLMKWRLVPQLDLEKVMKAKCLLLGSGTLGCGVARGLLGWGVRHISLVDNGKVSFSNPVRQSLFMFKDCLNGGKAKAVAAAEHLREIFPGVTAQGHELSIPMPGHPLSPATEAGVKAAYDKLEELISEHQVIFLLMDSRESRWLPTLMAAKYPDKLVINAALGFDTFLVMRHGVRLESAQGGQASKGLIPGGELGCYFCNDIVAPGDSTTDRTLDQQCTVTRPGASGTAAALAVELAISCLAHPLGPAAPAVVSGKGSEGMEGMEGTESVLGTVPHTIRGSLHNFKQFTPTGPAFSQCTACSPKVLDLFKKEEFELIRKVGENPKYLEDITGLTDLMSDTDLMAGVIDLADDDTFSVSSD
eukprot:GFUD01031500.1.p1 GENE.GFUD01031500.1~~GFUD01031500.1.p1  ORF type:complete len:680 (+),score=251.80 GFUD01031500.1:45-2084(+)